MSKINLEIPASGGTPYALDLEDEGVIVVSNPSAINFTGSGVTVIENPSGTAEVAISAGSPDIEGQGVLQASNPNTINFVGAGVMVLENPAGTAEVTIAGGNQVIEIQDEGMLVLSDPSYINFTGDGVHTTGFGGGISVNVPAFLIKDEGTTIIGSQNTNAINFVGAGVVVTESPSGTALVTIAGSTPYALDIEDDGGSIISNPDTINFTGAGVVVTESPSGTAQVTIAGSTPYALDIEDDGSAILSNPTKLNFNGAGVVVTENPSGVADISIAGSAGIASVFVDKVGVSGTTNGLQTSVKSYSLAANTYSNLELEITIQSAQNSNSAMVNDVTIRLNGSSSGISPAVFYCETTAVSAVANRLILTRLLKAVFTRTAAATLTIDVNNSNCNWEIQNVTLKGIP